MSMLRRTATGYTLIELLLYIALTSGLLIVTVTFYAVVSDARVKTQAATEVDQQGSFLMSYLTQTIRNATSISTPSSATSGSSLTLVVPTGSLSPTTFALNGTTLQVTEGTGAAVALSNSNVQVSGLTFTNLTRTGTNGMVRVSFTLARTNTAGRSEYSYQQTFTDSAEVRW
jgi:Tfp pilus assembly protein PilW